MQALSRRTALKRLAQLTMAAAGAAATGASRAQPASWPAKPIRLVVPYSVGTPPDIASRIIAQSISQPLGQTVFVDNKPGAIGLVGLQDVLRQPADGYNLYCLLMPVTTAPALLPGQKVDLLRDIEPVAQIDWTYSVLVINRDVPARNVKELVALMKAQPNGLSFASGGNGTPAHLSAEVFKAQQNVQATHVPYAQFTQAIPDLIGNRVQFMFLTSNVAVPQVAAGKVRALAVVGAQRLKALPDVPTMAEQGLGDFDTRSWDGIVVKAGTPRAVIERLNSEIVQAVQRADVAERFAELGMVPAAGTPQQFGDLIRREVDRWTRVVRAAGIKVD